MTTGRFVAAVLCLGFMASLAPAQQSTGSETPSIPHLIRFGGILKDVDGKPAQGTVGVTFAFYKEERGGVPLWMETQNVIPDSFGRYSVMLGSTKSDGLPPDLFISKEARWLQVEPHGLPAPVRILLLSVPYALKAADAETIGGLPPSAFVLAPPTGATAPSSNTASNTTTPPPASSVTTAGGTVNLIPLWSTSTDIENSAITQTGTGATAKIGINTAAPASTLDVKGGVTVRGTLALPATGAATAIAGKTSQPANLSATSFNSSTAASVNQSFQFKAEPAGNNTAAPSVTLNLLFGSGASAAGETGLKIGSNGQIAFAAGQTFPGTGNGTITGVTAGTDLIGGGSSGSVTLNLDTTKVVTGVTAGTDLTGGGTGGVLALNLDTTKVPQLSAANIFTASQTVTGNLTATATVTGSVVSASSSFSLAGNLFAFGSFINSNAYLGFAGTSSGNPGTNNTGVGKGALLLNTGVGNTAVGVSALITNRSGGQNTAVGYSAVNGGNGVTSDNTGIGWNALSANFSGVDNFAGGAQALDGNLDGSFNTGVGMLTLHQNIEGSYNSALGYNAGTDIASSALTNTTAIGALADVSQSNSMVLGSINGINGATADTNVGIGTTAPAFKLHIGLGNNGVRVEGPKLKSSGTPIASFGGYGDFAIDSFGVAGGRLVVKESGFVGIGLAANPTRIFTIGLNQGHALADGWDTYSSRRWKTNIHPLNDALHKVEQLRGVSYDMKASGKHEIGVIAEEVGKVLPEVVTFETNGKDAQSVDYSRLTAVLIEAVKQQQGEIQKQLAVLRAQAKSIRVLKSELRETRQSLTQIKTQLQSNHTVLAAIR